MKNAPLLILLTLVLCFSIGCPWYESYDFPDGHFPESTVNFSEVNTEYNDYNITAPEINSERLFHFSSDRNTQGADFDIVGEGITLTWNKNRGEFQCVSSSCMPSGLMSEILGTVNTSSDELGPYSMFYMSPGDKSSFIMFFARKTDGHLDNFLINAVSDDNGLWEIDTAKRCNAINSPADDGYVSLDGEGMMEHAGAYSDLLSGTRKVFFCSDRSGNFDIYEIAIPRHSDPTEYLCRDTSGLEIRNNVLSSGANDKCPYIKGDVIVFTSDREGGLGGFDLYYSIRTDDAWSEPVNFGEKINTGYDEYRPVLITDDEFDNDVIFFSSNRPGGKGGFDIYYRGITSFD